MNRVAGRGLVTAAVAGGVLACAGYAQADSAAGGGTADSPGLLSGNSVQAPVHIPVNACGNTVDVVGLLNSASGQACANVSGPAPHRPAPGGERPARPRTPAPPPSSHSQANDPGPALAHTGAQGAGYAAAAGGSLLLGGIVLRRRFRTGRR